jgi:hypothetical protein
MTRREWIELSVAGLVVAAASVFSRTSVTEYVSDLMPSQCPKPPPAKSYGPDICEPPMRETPPPTPLRKTEPDGCPACGMAVRSHQSNEFIKARVQKSR